MAKEIRLPNFGMTMETAQIVKWLHSEGEFVEKSQALLELQNDKAVVEFESPDSGYLRICAWEGDELPIGDLIGVLLDTPEEDYKFPD